MLNDKRYEPINLQDLKRHLQRKLPELKGSWVDGRYKYEPAFADVIQANHERERYWDCIWMETPLELKMSKSNHFWLDLVRYSEEYLRSMKQKNHSTVVTLFMFYTDNENRRNNRITDIYAVTVDKINQILQLTSQEVEFLVELSNKLRSLNAQARLTKNDIISNAEFHIH